MLNNHKMVRSIRCNFSWFAKCIQWISVTAKNRDATNAKELIILLHLITLSPDNLHSSHTNLLLSPTVSHTHSCFWLSLCCSPMLAGWLPSCPTSISTLSCPWSLPYQPSSREHQMLLLFFLLLFLFVISFCIFPVAQIRPGKVPSRACSASFAT